MFVKKLTGLNFIFCRYRATNSDAAVIVYTNVLNLLAGFCQPKYLYGIVNGLDILVFFVNESHSFLTVDANDSLYGSSPKFFEQVSLSIDFSLCVTVQTII